MPGSDAVSGERVFDLGWLTVVGVEGLAARNR